MTANPLSRPDPWMALVNAKVARDRSTRSPGLHKFCRCGGTGIRAALKTQSFGIRVRTPSSAPKLLLGGPRLLGNKNQTGGIGESTDRGSAPPAKWLGPNNGLGIVISSLRHFEES